MKSIITTYPHFQSLPRGIKKLLLISESHFFDELDGETKAPLIKTRGNALPARVASPRRNFNVAGLALMFEAKER